MVKSKNAKSLESEKYLQKVFDSKQREQECEQLQYVKASDNTEAEDLELPHAEFAEQEHILRWSKLPKELSGSHD